MNSIENIKTNNIPLLDELIYNLKKLSTTSVVKEEQKALENETIESQKLSDRYMVCIEGNARFEMFNYSRDLLERSSIPDYLIDECVRDKNNIPKEKRKEVLSMAVVEFLQEYEELNNYYRMLNGLPNVGEKGIKVNPLYIPDQIYDLIDVRKYVHEMNSSDIDILYTFEVIDKLMEDYPEAKYLRYMGSRSIEIYKARKATNFSLLYTISDIPEVVLNRFKDKYEVNRVYTLKTVYNDAFKLGSDYYDNFIQIFIIVQTMIDMIAEIPDMIIKKEVFDIRMIKLIFDSNGVEFFQEIPFKYQLAMVRNLNRLIKFKSTTTNIVDICSLFGFDNIEVFKYFLLKERKVDEYGEYEFNYIEDENGNLVDDIESNYDLKFIKVPIDDIADNYIHDKSKMLDYDQIVAGDKYWNGDLDHGFVKRSILEKEFNYIQSKYLSVDTIYSLTELSFQLIYFHNMIFDDHRVEELLKIDIPTISSVSKFKFVDVLCFLYSLMYEYNEIEDDIKETPTKVMHIKGFNFKADMEELSNYVIEKGFTLEELGVSDFQIPETQILSYNQLMHVFTKNSQIYDHILDQLFNADNKRIYDIYKKIYDSLMLIELSKEFFRKSNGEMATSYTDYIKDRDIILYSTLMEIKKIESIESKREKINNLMNDIIYIIEQYVQSDKYRFIFSHLPAVSAEAIKQYVFKVVNFFKSYKVDIMSINTIYKFDDKLENKINIIDSILFKYIYTKQSTIEAISKLKTTSKLTKEERIKLIDELYLEITFWVDLFFNTDANVKDSVKNKLISLFKKDGIDFIDTLDSMISNLSEIDFIECFCDKAIISKLNKKEKIELIENIFFEITFWMNKFFELDIPFKEEITKQISLLMRDSKYELYSSTYITNTVLYDNKVDINEHIFIKKETLI